MMLSHYRDTAHCEWEKAHRKVFWSRLIHNPRPLLSFDEVARFFQL